MAKKKKAQSGITDKHYLDFAEASSVQTTISVYGKLIKNSEAPLTKVGIAHPQGLSDPLQASLAYGVSIGGHCISLPSPEQVMLPAPDGPADACGWNPDEYVVWKNLPKEWVTLHLHVERRTLSDALLGNVNRVSMASAEALASVGDRVVAIVRSWAGMSSDPRGSDQLQMLWAISHPGGSFGDGAQLLVQRINDAFSTSLQPADLNPPDKIKTVDDLIDAIT
jgi:hypothetical protein